MKEHVSQWNSADHWCVFEQRGAQEDIDASGSDTQIKTCEDDGFVVGFGLFIFIFVDNKTNRIE